MLHEACCCVRVAVNVRGRTCCLNTCLQTCLAMAQAPPRELAGLLLKKSQMKTSNSAGQPASHHFMRPTKSVPSRRQAALGRGLCLFDQPRIRVRHVASNNVRSKRLRASHAHGNLHSCVPTCGKQPNQCCTREKV